jgi:hypothetical protein
LHSIKVEKIKGTEVEDEKYETMEIFGESHLLTQPLVETIPRVGEELKTIFKTSSSLSRFQGNRPLLACSSLILPEVSSVVHPDFLCLLMYILSINLVS